MEDVTTRDWARTFAHHDFTETLDSFKREGLEASKDNIWLLYFASDWVHPWHGLNFLREERERGEGDAIHKGVLRVGRWHRRALDLVQTRWKSGEAIQDIKQEVESLGKHQFAFVQPLCEEKLYAMFKRAEETYGHANVLAGTDSDGLRREMAHGQEFLEVMTSDSSAWLS
ncbi:MAG: hypothetical protein AAGA57_04145 [Planctomycetota bacterium]